MKRARYKRPYWNAIYTPNSCTIGSNAKILKGRTRALPTKALHLHRNVTHESNVSCFLGQTVTSEASMEWTWKEEDVGMEDGMDAEGEERKYTLQLPALLKHSPYSNRLPLLRCKCGLNSLRLSFKEDRGECWCTHQKLTNVGNDAKLQERGARTFLEE